MVTIPHLGYPEYRRLGEGGLGGVAQFILRWLRPGPVLV